MFCFHLLVVLLGGPAQTTSNLVRVTKLLHGGPYRHMVCGQANFRRARRWLAPMRRVSEDVLEKYVPYCMVRLHFDRTEYFQRPSHLFQNSIGRAWQHVGCENLDLNMSAIHFNVPQKPFSFFFTRKCPNLTLPDTHKFSSPTGHVTHVSFASNFPFSFCEWNWSAWLCTCMRVHCPA